MRTYYSVPAYAYHKQLLVLVNSTYLPHCGHVCIVCTPYSITPSTCTQCHVLGVPGTLTLVVLYQVPGTYTPLACTRVHYCAVYAYRYVIKLQYSE